MKEETIQPVIMLLLCKEESDENDRQGVFIHL
jgi:hypothetical protein